VADLKICCSPFRQVDDDIDSMFVLPSCVAVQLLPAPALVWSRLESWLVRSPWFRYKQLHFCQASLPSVVFTKRELPTLIDYLEKIRTHQRQASSLHRHQ
jgi:hypothetical protein